ncbi:21202_t:CDS:1, partial [Gigaspora rosea]
MPAKKRKKKNKSAFTISQMADIHHSHRKDVIWNTNNNEERQQIREFWLQL